jgi:hypothetical protein
MKRKITIAILILITGLFQTKAQIISDFDDLNLPMPPLGSYWNGSDLNGGFVNGGMYFNNSFDTSFGGIWTGGFAYSSVVDSVTSGFTNLYAAKAGSGFGASPNYAVVQQNAIALTNNPFPTMVVNGFYVTNSTYAYNSMRDGDIFARKFGDTTGTNSGLPQGSYPDYFKLTVKAYVGGMLGQDSVEFYLADYRFLNDSLDYIVNTWQWVDCSILQVFDSLLFSLTSSDNGAFGMNTPAFFCIDNLTIDVTVGTNFIVKNNHELMAYPNPASDFINIKNIELSTPNKVTIFSIEGQKVMEEGNLNLANPFSLQSLKGGVYMLQIQNKYGIQQTKFIKQ